MVKAYSPDTLEWFLHCLQRKSPLRAGQPTLRNARTLTQNDNRAGADNSETEEDTMMSMTVMPLSLGEIRVMSFLHLPIQMNHR